MIFLMKLINYMKIKIKLKNNYRTSFLELIKCIFKIQIMNDVE